MRSIEKSGGRGLAVPTAVAQLGSFRGMVQVTVEAFCRLDMLVINAGINGDALSVEPSNSDVWRPAHEVNLIGPTCATGRRSRP